MKFVNTFAAKIMVPISKEDDETDNSLKMLEALTIISSYSEKNKLMVIPNVNIMYSTKGPAKVLTMDITGFFNLREENLLGILNLVHDISMLFNAEAMLTVNGNSVVIDPEEISDTVFCKYPEWIKIFSVKLNDSDVSSISNWWSDATKSLDSLNIISLHDLGYSR